ncbi:MAG: hypothetical protein C0501_23800 [Isosphaera sp.]|nr:hypothetical protein [Isosphaera sp.]
MFTVNCDELRKASDTLLLPSPGYVGRYLGPRRRVADRPAEPPRGRGAVLGPSSETSFVLLDYDGSSTFTLSATDGHLFAVARVGVAPHGASHPWARWVPWWRWVWTVSGLGPASAHVRPVDNAGAELTKDRLRLRLPGPGIGLSPGEATGITPPPAHVLSAGEVDRPALARLIRLFAKAARPAPRHRTALALERDGSVGVTVGTVTWTAASDLRLPFVFSPSNPSLRPAWRWLQRLGGEPNPEGRVTVERVTDVHGRTFYRLTAPTGRHTLWVPEGRAVDRYALGQFSQPSPCVPGTEIRLPLKLVRRVAAGTLYRAGRGSVMAVEFRPAPDGGRGEFRIRGLGDAGIEVMGAAATSATGSPAVGWSIILPARRMLAALAPLSGEEVEARPLGQGRWLRLSDVPTAAAAATTAVVKSYPPRPHEPDTGAPPGDGVAVRAHKE